MEDAKNIRQWAKENGIAIRERGRLPRHVLQMYAFATDSKSLNEEVAMRFELLAKHLEPRFGNLYEGSGGFDEGQAWTPELKQAVREYLLDGLPPDVWAAMFNAPTSHEARKAREAEVDGWLTSISISPSDIALAVRDAAVSAQPTLDQITGQTDDWPGGEDQKLDAEFWLEAHASEQELRYMADFLHEDDVSLSMLIGRCSPAQLVKAWQHAVGPAPSDLTEAEWQLLRPLLPSDKNGLWEQVVRRGVNGLLYRFVNEVRWHDIPGRYGTRGALVQRVGGYKRHGVLRRALKALDENPEATRLVQWLRSVT